MPCASNVGPTSVTPTRPSSGGAAARASSWLYIATCVTDAPRPPYSTGQWMPTQPPACSVRCHSRSASASARVVATSTRGARMLAQPRPQLVTQLVASRIVRQANPQNTNPQTCV